MIIILGKSQHREGFTIIEILVATAILAMIFTMVFGTFFYTVKNAEEQEEQAALYQRVSFLLNNISQNISSACVPLSIIYLNAEERQPVFLAEDATIDDVDADSLTTFTTNARFAGRDQSGEVSYVTYQVSSSKDAELKDWLKDDNNPLILTCAVDSLFQKSGENDTEQSQWTMNISSLNLEFFDGTSWLQEWDYDEQGVLPRAVKIHLEIADSAGRKHAFSSTAFVQANALVEEPPEEAFVEEVEEEEAEEEEVELDEDVKEEVQEQIDEAAQETAEESSGDEEEPAQ